MGFRNNSEDYNIILEGELSEVLGNFDSDMIFDIVESNLKDKYRDYSTNLSNIVFSLEQNFKMLEQTYGSDELINRIREERYSEIIDLIGRFYNLEYTIGEGTNLYSVAFYMYSFFVADFSKNIITFLSNYIIREQSALFAMLDPDEVKKQVSTSSIYSKRMYGDNTQLAAIHSFLDKIIANICQFDIDLNSYVNTVLFGNKQVASFLNTIVHEYEIGSIYRDHIAPFIMNYRPIIVTEVKFLLQQIIQN